MPKKAGIWTPDERDFVILRDYFCPVDRKSFQEQTRKSIGLSVQPILLLEDVFEEGQEILVLVTESMEKWRLYQILSVSMDVGSILNIIRIWDVLRETENLADQIQNLCFDQV